MVPFAINIRFNESDERYICNLSKKICTSFPKCCVISNYDYALPLVHKDHSYFGVPLHEILSKYALYDIARVVNNTEHFNAFRGLIMSNCDVIVNNGFAVVYIKIIVKKLGLLSNYFSENFNESLGLGLTVANPEFAEVIHIPTVTCKLSSPMEAETLKIAINNYLEANMLIFPTLSIEYIDLLQKNSSFPMDSNINYSTRVHLQCQVLSPTTRENDFNSIYDHNNILPIFNSTYESNNSLPNLNGNMSKYNMWDPQVTPSFSQQHLKEKNLSTYQPSTQSFISKNEISELNYDNVGNPSSFSSSELLGFQNNAKNISLQQSNKLEFSQSFADGFGNRPRRHTDCETRINYSNVHESLSLNSHDASQCPVCHSMNSTMRSHCHSCNYKFGFKNQQRSLSDENTRFRLSPSNSIISLDHLSSSPVSTTSNFTNHIHRTPSMTLMSTISNEIRDSLTSSSPLKLDGQPIRKGDWVCGICQFHNFASKIACFTCRTTRPGFEDGIPPSQRDFFGKVGNREQPKPGDWTCPKCHENVFAKRTRCYRCTTTRPR